MKIENPTVAELICLLQTLPQDKPLRIEDADTNWTISIIHVSEDAEAIWLYGDYSEMIDD